MIRRVLKRVLKGALRGAEPSPAPQSTPPAPPKNPDPAPQAPEATADGAAKKEGGDQPWYLDGSDVDGWDETPQEDFEINLLRIPGQRMDVATISAQATVMQVQELLNRTGTEACCVTRTTAPMIAPLVGVITQNDIENYRDKSE